MIEAAAVLGIAFLVAVAGYVVLSVLMLIEMAGGNPDRYVVPLRWLGRASIGLMVAFALALGIAAAIG